MDVMDPRLPAKTLKPVLWPTVLKSHIFWPNIKHPRYLSQVSGTVTECMFYFQAELDQFCLILMCTYSYFSLQISFLASAYMSQHLSEESCSALASVTHYLYLCQFSWMLIQVGLSLFQLL